MDADTRRALDILDAIQRLPKEVGPVTLSQEYLDHIARVEALPQNQSGADKSWVHRAIEKSRRMYASAVLKR
jgi:hypothetical protein